MHEVTMIKTPMSRPAKRKILTVRADGGVL
jgi:hypothetical protein